MRGSEAISSTAHYTGYIWGRNGLSHPELATREGRVLFEALRPAMTLSAILGGPTLESYLLARHRAIDALLARAIDEDGVTQVIELACGLSPRGWRFASRYGPELTYIEADLPGMAGRKRRALARMGSLSERHRVEILDALRDGGPGSLAALAETLNPDAGLAIITEVCSATWSRRSWRACGAGSRANWLSSAWAVISRTSSSGTKRARMSTPSGRCCRCSSAAASTCTSRTRATPRPHCGGPGSPTPPLRRRRSSLRRMTGAIQAPSSRMFCGPV